MPAITDDNVWVTGVLLIITPIAIALALLPIAPALIGACSRACTSSLRATW